MGIIAEKEENAMSSLGWWGVMEGEGVTSNAEVYSTKHKIGMSLTGLP